MCPRLAPHSFHGRPFLVSLVSDLVLTFLSAFAPRLTIVLLLPFLLCASSPSPLPGSFCFQTFVACTPWSFWRRCDCGPLHRLADARCCVGDKHRSGEPLTRRVRVYCSHIRGKRGGFAPSTRNPSIADFGSYAATSCRYAFHRCLSFSPSDFIPGLVHSPSAPASHTHRPRPPLDPFFRLPLSFRCAFSVIASRSSSDRTGCHTDQQSFVSENTRGFPKDPLSNNEPFCAPEATLNRVTLGQLLPTIPSALLTFFAESHYQWSRRTPTHIIVRVTPRRLSGQSYIAQSFAVERFA